MFAKLVAPLRDKRMVASFLTSTVVHSAVLVAFWLITLGVQNMPEDLTLESILEKTPEKKKIQKVLRKNDTVSPTMNTVAGSTNVSNKVRASSKKTMRAAQQFEPNENMAQLDVPPPSPNARGIGADQMNLDLGEDGFKGEPTAIVSGYADALNRITAELVRLMRQDKLLVVWLFDESGSMKDDREEIAKNFEIVYKELQIVQEKDEGLKKRRGSSVRDKILLTTVYGYGESLHRMLEPTDDIEQIITTIRDKIPIDKSGQETMCTAIGKAILANRRLAGRHKRKLVLIVVTDESGDDGMAVEGALKVAKQAKSPIYFLGREAIFGYPYARHRWKDPKYNLTHWIRINRGPETAFPESLQWDGLHRRWDVLSSGFGPYEQVRLARETNGIFFVLPGEEEKLAGKFSKQNRQYRQHDMREYRPLWLSRGEYAIRRKRSKFRQTIWDVIVELNSTKHQEMLLPKFDRQLNIRQRHYPLSMPEFKAVARKEAVKALRAWQKLGLAIKALEEIKPLRAKEASSRWRANFDLALAQCKAFRVRLFQFMLVMDNHVNADPPPKPRNAGKKPSNEWWFRRTANEENIIEPNEAQYQRVKAFFKLKMSRDELLELLDKDRQEATELYKLVMERHPGTPWARRAKHELNKHGFGMKIYDRYWDPRYNRKDIDLPKL